MPVLHTPERDLRFVSDLLLPRHSVTVAEVEGEVAGFIAVWGEWLEQLYVHPDRTGSGVGSRLLVHATAEMPVTRLYCFVANCGARRFYERHGFKAAAFRDGSFNEERMSDILYVKSSP
jgi:GNAT superfamily N-acetyltransferase